MIKLKGKDCQAQFKKPELTTCYLHRFHFLTKTQIIICKMMEKLYRTKVNMYKPEGLFILISVIKDFRKRSTHHWRQRMTFHNDAKVNEPERYNNYK